MCEGKATNVMEFFEEPTKIKIKDKASLEIIEYTIEDNEEIVLELLSYLAARRILKTTPGEGDEGFEQRS